MEKTTKNLTKNEMLYNNKIIYKNDNNKIDKDTKNNIKNTILDIIKASKDTNKDNKYIYNMFISNDDYNTLTNALHTIIDFDIVLTFKDVKNAIISSLTNKMIASEEKYTKIEGYAVSIANFVKSIQATICKKIDSDKKQQFLIEQQKRLQAKIDKDKAKARKKANKQVEKKQKATGNLKTKIDN